MNLWGQGKKKLCAAVRHRSCDVPKTAHVINRLLKSVVKAQRRRFLGKTTEGGGGGGAFFFGEFWAEFCANASRADFNLSSSALSFAASASKVALDLGAVFVSAFTDGLGAAVIKCAGTMWVVDSLRFRLPALFAMPRFSCACEPKAQE